MARVSKTSGNCIEGDAIGELIEAVELCAPHGWTVQRFERGDDKAWVTTSDGVVIDLDSLRRIKPGDAGDAYEYPSRPAA